METAFSVLWPVVLGALGWITLEFVGRPIRSFFDLRRETRRQMLEYANVSARWKTQAAEPEKRQAIPISPAQADRLDKARNTYRDLASQARAFGETEHLATWVLQKAFRIDPTKAGAALFCLSNSIDTYGSDRAEKIKVVERALRIRQE